MAKNLQYSMCHCLSLFLSQHTSVCVCVCICYSLHIHVYLVEFSSSPQIPRVPRRFSYQQILLAWAVKKPCLQSAPQWCEIYLAVSWHFFSPTYPNPLLLFRLPVADVRAHCVNEFLALCHTDCRGWGVGGISDAGQFWSMRSHEKISVSIQLSSRDHNVWGTTVCV